MNEHDRSDPVINALLPLDERSGPASNISSERSASLIEGALDQWQAPVTSSRVAAWPALRTFVLAASALLAFVFGARAFYQWVTPPGVGSTPAARMTSVTTAPHRSPVVITPTPTPSAPASVPVVLDESRDRPRPVTEDWLLRANRLRAEGRFEDAVQAYNRVIRRDDGVSSYVARVAAASLMLEHLNDPQGARALFVAASRQMPAGSLELEIRRGMAEASRRLAEPNQP